MIIDLLVIAFVYNINTALLIDSHFFCNWSELERGTEAQMGRPDLGKFGISDNLPLCVPSPLKLTLLTHYGALHNKEI